MKYMVQNTSGRPAKFLSHAPVLRHKRSRSSRYPVWVSKRTRRRLLRKLKVRYDAWLVRVVIYDEFISSARDELDDFNKSPPYVVISYICLKNRIYNTTDNEDVPAGVAVLRAEQKLLVFLYTFFSWFSFLAPSGLRIANTCNTWVRVL